MHEAYLREQNQAWNEANRIQREKADKIRRDLSAKAVKQSTFAKNIACISPYTNFVYVATDLSGTGLGSINYFGNFSGEYFSLFWDYIGKKVQEATQKDPTFDTNSFLDISNRPRFSFKEEPLKNRLYGVLPYWGVLIFFNILFFIGAFVKFIKYDVR